MATVSNLATGDYITETWTDEVTNAGNWADAWTSYTPTLTNVTGGAVSGRYITLGKLVIFNLNITAGTATAAAVITASLPAGMTAIAATQPMSATIVTTVTTALVISGGSVVTIYGTSAGANFGLGASCANTRVSGFVVLA